MPDLEGDVLWALGAIVSATGAALMGWAAVLSARRRGARECEETLAALRLENETLAAEVHTLRMRRP